MLAAVAVAKIAGISTLLILAWFVVKIVRGAPADPSAPAEGPAPAPIGEMILRGFTWMLMIGVAAAFAISFGEVLDAL
ncbi:MAG: hypothetical protein CML46_10975 [Rhodobacteraceae bacterium]|nr:hypothetical protein [Paracoccaceae bacterium]MBR27449.1 hypothetical protein [Paracoccaceae bacterium]|tara:strand:- start:72 stop:305 length:234 start_codon:yes stop_codon:yes gene_type:complete